MADMSLTKKPMPTQDSLVRAKNFSEVALGYTKEMAMEEATRCLGCPKMPCKNGCPVQINIPDFITKVAEVEGISVSDEELEAEYAEMAKSYELEIEKIKEMVPAEELTAGLKTRKAVKVIVDSAVAVEPAPMEKVIGADAE